MAATVADTSGAIELIAAERQRQIDAEGWTPEHDDAEHYAGELVAAAICYAYHPFSDERLANPVPWRWPWEPESWKPTPKDLIRELIKAGALIAAEIERLQRRGAF